MRQPSDNPAPASPWIEVVPQQSARRAWLISIGLHAALLLAAVFTVPFGELTRGKPRTPRAASAAQVRHVTNQVRAAQEIEVRANLERIAEIEEEMRQLLEPKLTAYAAMEADLRATALADALAAQEQTLAGQRETLGFLRQVKAEPITQYGRGGDANRAQAEADAAQAAAGQALVRANDQRFVTIQQRLSALSEDEGRQRADQRHVNDRAKWEKD
ncbi:MAG TPA: hypothetical protein VK324_13965 [Tepidisphaeraceae bacterium]|nr:hypothetical protein [Tepidisphaeraceae bacterium]